MCECTLKNKCRITVSTIHVVLICLCLYCLCMLCLCVCVHVVSVCVFMCIDGCVTAGFHTGFFACGWTKI